MARIYIATAYQWKHKAEELAQFLMALGHQITSRWHSIGEEDKRPEMRKVYAKQDLEDIQDANCLVLITGFRGHGSHSGGRNVEFGYALAEGLQCLVLGQYESIFHDLAPRFDTREELLEFLGKDNV